MSDAADSLPVVDRWFRRRRVDAAVTVLDEPHVDGMIHANVWHVHGADRDLVIDSGCGIGVLRDALAIEGEEPLLVLTHDHLDHMGGAHEFAGCWAHPGARVEAPPEGSLLGATFAASIGLDATLAPLLIDARPHADYVPTDYVLRPGRVTRRLDEGDRVDLGDRAYTVLHVPGHSADSIALFDERDGVLFSGDLIYDDQLLDTIAGADPGAYRTSLRRLLELPVRIVHPGHGASFGPDRLRQIVTGYLAR